MSITVQSELGQCHVRDTMLDPRLIQQSYQWVENRLQKKKKIASIATIVTAEIASSHLRITACYAFFVLKFPLFNSLIFFVTMLSQTTNAANIDAPYISGMQFTISNAYEVMGLNK